MFHKNKFLSNDLWSKRIAVFGLSLTLVICAGGAIWLGINEKIIPELLFALGSGALVAIARMLSNKSGEK